MSLYKELEMRDSPDGSALVKNVYRPADCNLIFFVGSVGAATMARLRAEANGDQTKLNELVTDFLTSCY